MDLVKWDASLETGNSVVDQQHRGLFNALNQLIQAMNRGKGRDEVHKTLVFMRDYTKRHFASEESIMESHGYPELAEHREMHAAFVKKLQQIEDRYERGASVTISVMQFIRDWLIQHIQEQDQRMTQVVGRNAGLRH